jgi:hypothetical protein
MALACGDEVGGSDSDGGDGATSGCPGLKDAATCEAADPLEWAEWPMPNSPRDFKRGAPNLESYTNNGDGTVTDDVTGLMWQKKSPQSGFTCGCAATPGTAQAYCASLSLGGHIDWRMPTYIELISLLDYSKGGQILFGPDAEVTEAGTAIDTTYFDIGTTTEGVFWTNSALGDSAWGIDFYHASPIAYDTATRLGARCVR